MSARRPSKFGNVRTNGFASKREAKRYAELLLLEKAGVIRNLKIQPRFALAAAVISGGLQEYNAGCVNGARVFGEYRADFSYEECDHANGHSGWRFIVEDVKGFRNQLYNWKRRHMKAQYEVEIRET